jgi:carboxymethylenebutenolidase
MIAENKLVDIKIYDGAGHAFENPTNKSGYRLEAAADAWFRTLAFFDQAKESKTAVS